jgi:drug/metabolite transporter (DMT)-like permease
MKTPFVRALPLPGTVRLSQVQRMQPCLSMALAVPLLGETPDAPTLTFAEANRSIEA